MSSKKLLNACRSTPRYVEPCSDTPPTDTSVLSRLVDLNKQVSDIVVVLEVALGTIESLPEDPSKGLCNESSIFGYLGALQNTINQIDSLSRIITQKLGQR